MPALSPGAYAAEGLDSYVYYARYYGWTRQTNRDTSARADVARNGEDADGQYILEYGVAAEPQIDDSFYRLRQEITRAQGQFVFRVGVGAALLLAALASLVCLLCLSAGEGWRPHLAGEDLSGSLSAGGWGCGRSADSGGGSGLSGGRCRVRYGQSGRRCSGRRTW